MKQSASMLNRRGTPRSASIKRTIRAIFDNGIGILRKEKGWSPIITGAPAKDRDLSAPVQAAQLVPGVKGIVDGAQAFVRSHIAACVIYKPMPQKKKFADALRPLLDCCHRGKGKRQLARHCPRTFLYTNFLQCTRHSYFWH